MLIIFSKYVFKVTIQLYSSIYFLSFLLFFNQLLCFCPIFLLATLRIVKGQAWCPGLYLSLNEFYCSFKLLNKKYIIQFYKYFALLLDICIKIHIVKCIVNYYLLQLYLNLSNLRNNSSQVAVFFFQCYMIVMDTGYKRNKLNSRHFF